MVCVDFIDQKVYSEAEGLFVSDFNLGIKGLIRARYPFALDSDFISYGNLSHYCMNYLDEIVQRAIQKNEKIKYNVTTLMKEKRSPSTLKSVRTSKQLSVNELLMMLHVLADLGLLLSFLYPLWLFGCWLIS